MFRRNQSRFGARVKIGFAATVAALVALSPVGCASDDDSPPSPGPGGSAETSQNGRYESVNGLSMYYETYGTGRPLVLLHGGFCTIDVCLGKVIPILARTHQVIAIEQQGHGHTGDIDRPFTYEQMAQDTTALLERIGIDKADFFGFSLGANIALRIAMRHPNLVDHVVALAPVAYDNVDPSLPTIWEQMSPEQVPSVFQDGYAKTAPDPKRWPAVVAKMKTLLLEFKGWSEGDIRSIQAPTLLMIGDRDLVLPEPAAKTVRLLPHGQLSVLPGSDHSAILVNPEAVVASSVRFLESRLEAHLEAHLERRVESR
ncbi:alpha/beta fold hydrolase [Pendulispora albinea]|uniref:Alpha/beta hydrolase n=1 Tax=Pendulispora albinea TaxID=2741071 RepID=A0ABZ2M3F3_9BACT